MLSLQGIRERMVTDLCTCWGHTMSDSILSNEGASDQGHAESEVMQRVRSRR